LETGLGAQLAAALRSLGFKDDIVKAVPKENAYGHLNARGWARHVAAHVYCESFKGKRKLGVLAQPPTIETLQLDQRSPGGAI
jgi:hypothetical protein